MVASLTMLLAELRRAVTVVDVVVSVVVVANSDSQWITKHIGKLYVL